MEPSDSQASLRAELSEQVANAQADLEQRLAELRRAGDGGALAIAENQLQGLSSLRHQIGRADRSLLAELQMKVAAYVAAVQALAPQASTSAATAQAAETALHAASEAAHREVVSFMDDFYEKKIFDPYLRFSSAEDEQEYRRREAEREQTIKEALAEGTPEGNLRANRLAIEQLKDAGAHGADRSPLYQSRLDGLKGKEDALASQITTASERDRSTPSTSLSSSDPVDRVGAPIPLDPAMLAEIRAIGMVVADQRQSGHGISQDASPASPKGRV